MSLPRDTGRIFEELKTVIQDLDRRVGTPVANVNGVVRNAALERTQPTESTWYVTSTRMNNSADPTLSNIANSIAYEQPGFAPILSINGEVSYSPPEDDIAKAHMFMTTVKVQGPSEYPIEVTAQGYDISIYIGARRVGTGRNTLLVSPSLEVGDTQIYVIASGGSGNINVSVPAVIETTARLPSPSAPMWASEITAEYLNNEAGSLVIDMNWSNDPFAGSWTVYRATSISLGIPDSVVDLTGNQFQLTYTGQDLRSNIVRSGLRLYTDLWAAGTISSISYSTDTVIVVNLDDEASVTTTDWEAVPMRYPGQFYARARLGYDFGRTIQWRDTDVRRGTLYFYKVTAHDFLSGSAESNFSPVRHIYPGNGPLNVSIPAHAWLPQAAGDMYLQLTLVPGTGVTSVHIQAIGEGPGGAFNVEYDLNLASPGDAEIHIIEDGGGLSQYWIETSPNNRILITPYDAPDGAAGTGEAGQIFDFLVPVASETSVNIFAYETMTELELDGVADFLTVWDTSVSKTKKITVEDFVSASGVVPINLGDLLNVDETTTPPVLGDWLTYDGGSWVPAALSSGDISGLSAAIDARLDTDQVISGAWTFNTHVDFGAYIQLDNSFVPGGAPDTGFTGLWSTGDNLRFQTSAGSVRTVLHDGDSILESQITDGAILARVASTETITGTWTFNPRLNITNTGTAQYSSSTLSWGITEVAGTEIQSYSVLGEKDTAGAATGRSDLILRAYTKDNNHWLNVLLVDASAQNVGFFRTDSGTDAAIQRESWNFTVGNTFNVTYSGVVSGGTWQASPIGYAYGGTGNAQTTAGDILFVNSTEDGWQRVGHPGAVGYYLRTNSTNTMDWSDGIAAADVGAGAFPSGTFSFPSETRFSTGGTSKRGISLRNNTTPGDDPVAGYTGIWSTGDNLFFQEGGPNTSREVLHDAWAGTISGSWDFTSTLTVSALEVDGVIADSLNTANSFLDLSASGSAVVLGGIASMVFLTDTNNNSTADSWTWKHGSTDHTLATEVMSLSDEGDLEIQGNFVVPVDAWMGINQQNGLYLESSTGFGATINSASHIAFTIDANNNETTRYFTWRHNNEIPGSASEIMRLDEAGTLSLISAAVGTEIMSFPGTAGLNRITTQGGWALWGDSSVWVHAGDSVTSHVAAAGITSTTTDEHLYLTSDGHIYIASNTQANWASRHEWQFANNGNTDFPTGTISVSGVITGMTWHGATIGVQYGGTGLTDVQISRGDLLWANADGSLTPLTWVDSGRYLQSAGSPGNETLQWVDGINAGDVGDGTFTGNFSFSADVMINQPDYGIWVKTDGTPSSDPPANYTGIFSTGDNLRFKHNTTGIRDVVHDAWSGTISGSVFLSGTTRFGTNTSQGAAWTDNSATSLDQHQIGNLSGSWGILGRIGVGQDFGIAAASANNAILSRILMRSSGIALQYGTSTRINVTSTGATVTGVLSVTDDVLFNTSDETLKNILGVIDDPVARFRELGDGVFYTWNDEARELGHMDTEVRAGLIAQKVKKALGPAAYVDSDGKLGYKPEMLDALIVTVLQEVLDRLEVLENGER